MKDTISNYDLLLIRSCKRNCNDTKLNILRRIIAKRCGLYLIHVDKCSVIHFLTHIVFDYGLIKEYDRVKFLLEDLNPKKWYSEEYRDYKDNLIDVLVGKIASTHISMFPRYPRPAWFKNKYKDEA